jgi:hypothetical protein
MSRSLQPRSVLPWGTRVALLLLLLVGSGAHAHDPIPVPIAISASALERAVIVTSFGPLIRDGASARFLCETDDVAEVRRYLVEPDGAMIALADRWLATWDPLTCAWHQARVGRLPIVDAQLEHESGTLLVLTSDAQSSLAGERTTLLRASPPYRDLIPLARLPDVAAFSVLAAPAARVIYLGGSTIDHAPVLLRSADGGGTFQRLQPESDLTVGIYRVLFVDPGRPERILVRASGVEGDFLLRSESGGNALVRVDEVQGRVLRAVRLASGDVALLTEDEREQRLYVGGFERSFQPQALPVRVRDLTSAGEQLVALAEATTSGLVLLSSHDRGASWSTHSHIVREATIERCLESRPECQASCRHMADLGWIASAACPMASEAVSYPRPTIVSSTITPASAGQRPEEASSQEGCASSGPSRFVSSALCWLLARWLRRKSRWQRTATSASRA